jgi:hypothetical protein
MYFGCLIAQISGWWFLTYWFFYAGLYWVFTAGQFWSRFRFRLAVYNTNVWYTNISKTLVLVPRTTLVTSLPAGGITLLYYLSLANNRKLD